MRYYVVYRCDIISSIFEMPFSCTPLCFLQSLRQQRQSMSFKMKFALNSGLPKSANSLNDRNQILDFQLLFFFNKTLSSSTENNLLSQLWKSISLVLKIAIIQENAKINKQESKWVCQPSYTTAVTQVTHISNVTYANVDPVSPRFFYVRIAKKKTFRV